MTTYTVIPDSDIDPESPLTTGLMTLLRDNPLAVFEGHANSPAQTRPGLICLDKKVAASSAQLDFTSQIDATFDEYVFKISGLRPANDGANLFFRGSIDGGSSFLAGTNYDYGINRVNSAGVNTPSGSGAAPELFLSGGSGVNNASTYFLSGEVKLWLPSSTVFRKMAFWELAFTDSTDAFQRVVGGGVVKTTSAVNAVRFVMSAGNITEGTVAMYGVRKV